MLPQRRKSAEEIAKLRESMGIPGVGPTESAGAAGEEVGARAPTLDLASASDKKSLTSTGSAEPRPEIVTRPVRSLRKSEQLPVRPSSVDLRDDASLPIRRKSERELMELRRIQPPQPDRSLAHLRMMEVPWPVILFGYLLPLVGAFLGAFAAIAPGMMESDFPALWMGILSRKPWLGLAGMGSLGIFCGSGFLLSAWFAWKKPRSRHHAGFISLLCLLVLVFGILQLIATHAP